MMATVIYVYYVYKTYSMIYSITQYLSLKKTQKICYSTFVLWEGRKEGGKGRRDGREGWRREAEWASRSVLSPRSD